MIESCTVQRMILGIIFLGGLTILVLVIESNWTSNNSNSRSIARNIEHNSSDACWLNEDYEVVEECHPCTDFEIASKSNKVCAETHYKEAVNCQKSGKVYRSCDKVKWLEEKKFWQFEGTVFLIACLSTAVVHLRQKILDHRMLRRIQRQIANSV